LRRIVEAGVDEVLVVAFHASDRRVDDVNGCAALLDDAVADTLDGGLAGFGVAHDAALADVEAAGFELGLDEDDGFAMPWRFRSAERGDDGWKDESGGDEGDVHREEDRWGRTAGEEFGGSEEAGVGSLAQGDSGIVAKLLGDLAVAGVDGEDCGCSALQHAIGEAAGGGADVDAREAGERDGPVFERAFELETAAADELEIRAEEADDRVGWDGGAGLVDPLFAYQNAAGEDESLGSFAGGSVAEVDKEFVEANLFDARFRRGHHAMG
jgi:hypothetical protein